MNNNNSHSKFAKKNASNSYQVSDATFTPIGDSFGRRAEIKGLTTATAHAGLTHWSLGMKYV